MSKKKDNERIELFIFNLGWELGYQAALKEVPTIKRKRLHARKKIRK